MRMLSRRGCCGPRSSRRSFVPHDERSGIGGTAQILLVQMAQDPIARSVEVRVAKRLWRVLRRAGGFGCVDPLYRRAGDASPQADVSGRISRIFEQIWN